MPASTYTYARLDHGGHEIWVAGPETALAVGAKVGPLQGTLMTNFHSDTLNRTFPEIYFVSTFGDAADAYVDGGPVMKRWRARARGRVARIRKRTCHITVRLTERPEPVVAAPQQSRYHAAPSDSGGGGFDSHPSLRCHRRRRAGDHD